MFPDLTVDIKRYIRVPDDKQNVYLFFEQGIWALIAYRFGRWAGTVTVPLISHLLRIVAYLWFKFIEIITGISLPASAQIGKGLYAGHFGGIIS